MPAPSRLGRRWIVVALLFTATVINYVDRQMLGLLKPTLSVEFGWTETDYADIVFVFQAAYAVCYLLFGRFIDIIGARWGYALAFTVWNLAHIAHAAASTLTQFMLARLFLGAGEAGNFPAGLKAVADWFPKKERALAVGVFNAGANIGAIITPLIVPVITLAWGWQAAFVVTGVLSFAWLAAWLAFYRTPETHPTVTAEELAHIRSDAEPPVTGRIGWGQLMARRETWAYALAKFLTDPVWWLFLFWLPDFLHRTYGLDLKGFGPPLVAIYILSDVGSVAGGWLSSRLIRGGTSLNRSRKLAMLACAACVLPVVFATAAADLWVAVLILGLATAGHQGFSANLLTLPSDLFPRAAVASVVGIGGMAGAVGGMLMSKFTGWILDSTGSYTPILLVAAGAYPLALLFLHLLSPRLAPAAIQTSDGP
ncbi:MFS transporter [Niveispirillum lacus]|uniref:MFS transporter n=1 Tax=Niveispirillum lacus TaxID=1981099 RepID=A0A255Z3Z6_9PROT|nr:MFS transporter [Niveispirillum lacus]OYQ36227.1 MFS transporter [Niveispirillum lacus]